MSEEANKNNKVGKKKLTLSIDADVIKKAKELNLNISNITEQILKGKSPQPVTITSEELEKSFRQFLLEIMGYLKKWEITLLVGEEEESQDMEGNFYMLSGDYLKHIDGGGNIINVYTIESTTKLPVYELFPPDVILKNLINNIYKKNLRNTQLYQKLELVKNILNLSNNLEGKKK